MVKNEEELRWLKEIQRVDSKGHKWVMISYDVPMTKENENPKDCILKAAESLRNAGFKVEYSRRDSVEGCFYLHCFEVSW